MPREKSPNGKSTKTMLRHWELLSLLPSRGHGKTAQELTEGLLSKNFSVTKRQVERDLLDLEELSFLGIQCNDKGMPYGWLWPKAARERALGATLGQDTAHESSNRLTLIDRHLAPVYSSGLQDSAPFFGREWLFEKLRAQLNEMGPAIFVVRGDFGVGKSAFLSRLLQRHDPKVLAHYACPPFGRKTTQDLLKEFTHTLASQLANHHPAVSSYLTGRLEAPQDGLQACSSENLFRQLVVQSLAQMPRQSAQAIIVIDGLETCALPDGQNSLLDLLLTVQAELPNWLRVVIGSRPIPALDQPSSQLRIIDIDPTDPCHLADLRSFAEYRLASRLPENKRTKQIEGILRASQGSFLYLSAIVNSDDLAQLKSGKLPSSLDEFYAKSFTRLFPDANIYQAQHAEMLSFLAGTISNIPESILCHVLDLSQRQLFRLMTPWLGQMILRQEDSYRLVHPSLADWLSDPYRSGVYSVERDGMKKIADWLTQRICKSDWKDVPPRERQDCLNILPSVVSSGQAWSDVPVLAALARVLHSAYRYQAEEVLIKRLLTLVERTPENHVQLIQALCQQAGNLRVSGYLEDAFAALNRAENLARTNIPEPHVIVIDLNHQYGVTYYRQKEYLKAADCFIRAADTARKLPETELKLAELLNNAGRMLSHIADRHSAAEQYLIESLELRNRILGAEHPVTGATLNNLGFFCSQSNRLNDAEHYYLRALAAKNSRDTQISESISLAESNLGSLYLRLEQYDKAEAYLLRALESREALYGINSIPVAKIIKKLANVYKAQNRGEESRELLQRIE